MILEVVLGSDAATRGLKPGDVLLSYNGTALRNPEDLKAVVETGRSVPVEFWRAGKVGQLELAPGRIAVKVDSRPTPVALAEERKLRQVLAEVRSGSKVFAPLPGARDEVNAIAQLFQSSRKLIGREASEPELERLATSGELGKFRVIHLATHGVIDEGIPFQSAVILTQTGLPDPLDQALNHKPVFDGRLTVREIQTSWKLNAELVTLSACETALGREAGGEGFVGFTQALLMSGARSVCLSLWKVDDAATALLMTRFYQNWLGKRPGLEGKALAKAEALREAKEWLRGLTSKDVDLKLDQNARAELKKMTFKRKSAHPYAHPHYWAGFILTGDPD